MASNAELAESWISSATEDPAGTGTEIQHPHEFYGCLAQAHAILAVAEAIQELTRTIGATRGRP
ncbi:MAG: hypothetical protein ACRDTO_00125 [Mycobacterium sp.]